MYVSINITYDKDIFVFYYAAHVYRPIELKKTYCILWYNKIYPVILFYHSPINWFYKVPQEESTKLQVISSK